MGRTEQNVLILDDAVCLQVENVLKSEALHSATKPLCFESHEEKMLD